MTPLLQIKDLTAAYGTLTVLHSIALEMQTGAITALLGANGAGKTSTLRAICGMIERRGTINFKGRPIGNLRTEAIARLGVAHVPDGRGTFSSLTVEENLQMGAMSRPARRDILEDMEIWYERFPRLKERRRQQAGTLSGGEQQMLAIARAMMLRPDLLLLDEPSFGLAPKITEQIFRTLADVRNSQGTSMLIVEQNANLALEIADHAYVIETGTIVMGGAAATVMANEAVRAAYLGY
ncbi:ABC transporter ATP-binding protein [Agrobacterium tumefaciens]|uniref:ABC transporter ATP-binding protein n=1 Tax=Agrobacterium tumefaciens TaxID=358 RepID=UPI00157357BE|nr:ABC transporter ATP-binding protein [Agrobacterium tumefaciens]NTE68213.1 ABC transporter ATP-binding protein [Agrobacterium tumefaciens]